MSLHPSRKKNPQAKCPTVKQKDLKAMIAVAWKAGWWCEASPGGHVKCYSPNVQHIIWVPSTPSDRRTIPNKRSQFKRAGLKV